MKLIFLGASSAFFGCKSGQEHAPMTNAATNLSTVEMWNASGGPELVSQYRMASIENRRRFFNDLLFTTNSVLFEKQDNSTNLVLAELEPICSDLNLFDLPEITPFIGFRTETNMTRGELISVYKLMNFNLVCPNVVANDLKIKYAVVMHRLLFEAQVGNDERAIWDKGNLSGCSQETVVDWILEQAPEKFRRGVDVSIPVDEWIETIRENFFSESSINSRVLEAAGRLAALSFLEMIPLGDDIYENLVARILGKNSTISGFVPEMFIRGFHSIISAEKLQLLSVEELTKILAGIPINADFVFLISEDPIVADLIGRNATVLSEWALIAAGEKRIAITNLGRRIWIRVEVDPNQADDIVRHPGWRISLSPQYVSGLNRL